MEPIHIKIGIAIAREKELKRSVNEERIKDYEKFFSDLYVAKIKKKLTTDKWGIRFMQVDELTPKFGIYIYVETPYDYIIIEKIISSDPPKNMEIEILPPHWPFDQF
jgi:hypothetical protein